MSAWRRLLGGGVASGAALLVWANLGRSAQSTMTTHDPKDPCAHDARVDVAIVADYDDVPELHDCQRFIVKRDSVLVYDSVFRILSIPPRLTTAAIDSALGPVKELPTERVEALFTTTGGGVASPLRLFALAVIEAGGAYDPLGIKAGTNCLYVFRFKPSPLSVPIWRALLAVPTGKDCSGDWQGTPKQLEVRPMVIENFDKDADYPAVARWDWDATNSQQYIGIKCGTAWCEIGPPGFSASEPIPVLPGTPRDERRVRLIKGWHDRQLLAFKNDSGKLVPSRVTGILIPHPKLAEYSLDSLKKNRLPVASVLLLSWLSEDKPVLKMYEKKYHIDTPGSKGLMQMGIKLETDSTGEARIRNPNNFVNKDEDRDVRRHPFNDRFKRTPFHQSGKTPGAVRWRWMETDEGTWVRCSEGCCEMTG